MSSVAEIFESMSYGPAPESETIAREWLATNGHRFGHFIGGEWKLDPNSAAFDTVNPANGDRLATISQGMPSDVGEAVRAAGDAFAGWSGISDHARARYLYALARSVQKHARLFAVLESLDNGKSIRETRDIDVPLVARHFYHHAGWAQLRSQEFPDYGPLGVVGQIIPWNFPLLMLAWKVAPALAAGNTVVLKPAEFTPLTAALFAEITREVGLPPGVFNLVNGDGSTGQALVSHPDVKKIAFTGSTDVGRSIRKETAGSGKALTLELGGKSPFIVFDSADLDSVVEGVVDAIWFNQGQVCCAGSRLLVQEGIADDLIRRLRVRMETLRVGSPTDKAVDMGAIIAPSQLERIERLVNQGVEEGATRWQPSWACPTDGWFYPPTLLTDVTPSSTVAQVEIFGPVLVGMTFRTPDEAVKLANNTPYGLAASVWSDDINLALDIAPRVKAGVVWVNCTNVFDAAAGFGGYRESGYGREGGREGMWAYLTSNREPGSQRTAYQPSSDLLASADGDGMSGINRTPKLYIGGRQARPDGGYTLAVSGADGRLIGQVGAGNRKDIRNAVEAANKASGWAKKSGHQRAQILYYIAENLSARAAEFSARLQAAGMSETQAEKELEASLSRLFTYGAWADKFDGAVHDVPIRGVTLAMNEPIGVIGIVAPDENPLLSLISVIAPAITAGNTTVVVPSRRFPLAATDFYGVLDTSDVPAGVVNIVTGDERELSGVLTAHDDVDALWCFGDAETVSAAEHGSTGNLKRVWGESTTRDWFNDSEGSGREFLRHATQVKNIWIPYGA